MERKAGLACMPAMTRRHIGSLVHKTSVWATVVMERCVTRKGHAQCGERDRETRLVRARKVRSVPTLRSPVLSNVYLDKLDKFVEEKLIPAYTKGEERGRSKEYNRLLNRAHRQRKKGNQKAARLWTKQAQQVPSVDPRDPNFRRLRYVRYADDFCRATRGRTS
jgi:hypothetical protein